MLSVCGGTEERLRAIIAEVALVEPQSFGLDDDLAGSGVDSLSVLRVVAHIESELRIAIPDHEFPTIRSLRALIAAVETRVLAGVA